MSIAGSGRNLEWPTDALISLFMSALVDSGRYNTSAIGPVRAIRLSVLRFEFLHGLGRKRTVAHLRAIKAVANMIVASDWYKSVHRGLVANIIRKDSTSESACLIEEVVANFMVCPQRGATLLACLE